MSTPNLDSRYTPKQSATIFVGPPTGGDDSAQIQTALTTVAATGGSVQLGAGTYVFAGSTTLNISSNTTLKGQGPGATKISMTTFPVASGDNGQPNLLRATGTKGTTSYVSSSVSAGSLTVNVSGTTLGINPGDVLVLGEQSRVIDSTSSTFYVGELIRVASVGVGAFTTTLTLASPTKDYYNNPNAFVQTVALRQNIHIEGIEFVNASPSTSTGMLQFKYCENVSVSKCRFTNYSAVAINIWSCIGGRIDECTFTDGGEDVSNGLYGYGVNLMCATEEVTVSSCRSFRGRHLVTTNSTDGEYGMPRNCLITGCVSTGSSNAPFDTHPQGKAITFSNCSVVGSRSYAFNVRSPDSRVMNCTASWCYGGVNVNATAHGAVISNNVFRHNLYLLSTGGAGVEVSGAADHVAIINNEIDYSDRSAIIVSGNANYLDIQSNDLKNTGINGTPAPGINFNTTTCLAPRIEDNKFANIPLAGASNDNAATGLMNFIIVAPSTVSAGWIVNNTATGLTGVSILSDAGGNIKYGNRRLDVSSDLVATTGDATMLATSSTPRISAPERSAVTGNVTLTSGRLFVNGFTPAVDMTVSNLFAACRGTAASGSTLTRFGLFTVDSSGNLALVARTASDTTLFTATFTTYTKPFDTTGGYPATYKLLSGQRYAVGVLVVGATTAPVVYGLTMLATEAGWQPFLSLGVSGQTDIGTTYTSGSLVADGNVPGLAVW